MELPLPLSDSTSLDVLSLLIAADSSANGVKEKARAGSLLMPNTRGFSQSGAAGLLSCAMEVEDAKDCERQ